MPVAKHRPRVVLEKLTPEIDAGRFPIKRVVGEKVNVEIDAFTDGHDEITVELLFRHESGSSWTSVDMVPTYNDHWLSSFTVESLGTYVYTARARIDHFKGWRRDLARRLEAGQQQDVAVELIVGAMLVEKAAGRAEGEDKKQLQKWAKILREGKGKARENLAFEPELYEMVHRYPDTQFDGTYERELKVTVDRERARFSAWYEMFPRSTSIEPGTHGTFRDVEQRLPYVAEMGFDVVYLPPIHPIGHTNRKGKNNALVAQPDDLGSPWGIGSEEGGHKAIHPQLGTLADFKHLIAKAREMNLEIAIDIAFQASPDHPWAKEHPEFFKQLPDGSIRYAENPPKKYQDIYPINFESENWEELWDELLGVMVYWIEQGVHIFRVDNPHTKAFGFWEWAIAEMKSKYPDVILLAEAFTRPKVMYRLAKLGYTQSYTYFAWRNSKEELTQYFTELTQTEVKEYFRPNVWPNTPDILTEYLQHGGRGAFLNRLVLAATLAASYGIYGPAFEHCVNAPQKPGSEEYLYSEKYQRRDWDWDNPESLAEIIGRVNGIRQQNPALQSDEFLQFHPIDNPQMICYSKRTEDNSNVIICVVNLDPHHTQAGFLDLPLDLFEQDWNRSYQMHDLLSDARYTWQGGRNFVQLNPHAMPAHIFCLRRHHRTEHDFEYYL